MQDTATRRWTPLYAAIFLLLVWSVAELRTTAAAAATVDDVGELISSFASVEGLELREDVNFRLEERSLNDAHGDVPKSSGHRIGESTESTWGNTGIGVQSTCEDELLCEEKLSWALVLVICVLVLCVFLTYFLVLSHFRYLPESVAVIGLGVCLGAACFVGGKTVTRIAGFDPEEFFLFILPPIIFESGYSLHKGNFFKNFGSIVVFAVFGTMISTAIVGMGLYFLGSIGLSYPLPLLECLVFGALISAVDPVATLAIFHSLNVDPTLHMLVFGESVLNDAVAIVLFRTLIAAAGEPFTFGSILSSIWEFFLVSGGSIVIGISVALVSALTLKYTKMRQYPSLEMSLMFAFAYLPYLLAEGLDLSGIMAILFCGVVMAHYTHFNLSPTSQITAQQTFRMMAFVAETAVFAYLGLAVLSMTHNFDWKLCVWSMALCFVGRAANIYPLSLVVNSVRRLKISSGHQFIMFFSGLRGAIAFALAMSVVGRHAQLIVTTTLALVLFTIVFLGGGTFPVLKLLGIASGDASSVNMSKTEEMGVPVDASEAEATTENDDSHSWFESIDNLYLKPIFRSPLTDRLPSSVRRELQSLTTAWNVHDLDNMAASEDDYEDDFESKEAFHVKHSDAFVAGSDDDDVEF